MATLKNSAVQYLETTIMTLISGKPQVNSSIQTNGTQLTNMRYQKRKQTQLLANLD